MRKVIAATFVSLDGVMQAPGGPEEDTAGGFKFGGWTFPYWDDVMGEAMGATFNTAYDLLLGRKTYEIFAAHWPQIQNDPIADSFNAVKKYVATRSDRALTWNNSVALRDAAADVARLKQQDGPVLLIQGSSDLIQTLLANDLVDEYRLLVFPVVLGRGKKLFGNGALPIGLKLVESKASTTGVIISTYVRAGEVKTGSFALEQPSQAELERRAQVATEG
jgi:dihydrofolate reductase